VINLAICYWAARVLNTGIGTGGPRRGGVEAGAAGASSKSQLVRLGLGDFSGATAASHNRLNWRDPRCVCRLSLRRRSDRAILVDAFERFQILLRERFRFV
jgi:hypothetical protein